MSPVRLFLSLLVVGALQAPAAAQKTDLVTLDNGDVLTGDIKALTRGKLRFKTDRMDTVYIEWLHIQHLESTQEFQVQLANGEYLFGSLQRVDGARVLRVGGVEKFVDAAMDEVIFLDPIDATFRSRINGSVSLGFSYTKASDVGSLSFFLTPTYRTRKYVIDLTVSSISTIDHQSGNTRREEYSGSYTRFLADRWFLSGGGGVESNEELGLELRSFLGAGVGRHLVQTKRSTVDALAGFVVNHEDYTMGEGQENLEGLVKASYSVYDFDVPIKDIAIDVSILPNLTDSGRVRVNSNARVRWELVKDLTLDLTLYGDYDSGSDVAGAATGDYGIVSSIGFSL
jgi:hypothetical protein